MTGLHYPDNLYADHEERKARRSQQPTGAYRSTQPIDPVTKPAHYQRAGIETIDYIRATLGDGFEAYCIGNVLKYVSRYREKGGIEDLRKAQVYLGWAIEPVKAEPDDLGDGACDVASPIRFASEVDRVSFLSDCVDSFAKSTEAIRRHVPKWDPKWVEACPQRVGAHPMQAETIRDHDERASTERGQDGNVVRSHDERLKGGEDRL